MNDGSRAATPVVIAGLDLGDEYSYLCLIDTDTGNIVEESKLRTTPEALRRRFDSEGQMTVAIEVHRLEDVGDSTSRRAIAELFSDPHTPLEVIKLKDLYDLLEDALDRCEQVANVLEGIAIKNA